MKVEDGAAGGAGQEVRDERAVSAGWSARLELEIARDGRGASRLRRAEHEGPLRVQRPFYPEGADGPCHVYVLHPPGGVVGGDTLALDVKLGRGAAALLTAPGASKLYRADARRFAAGRAPGSALTQRFRVQAGAILEWFPHESIVYDGAHASLRTHVELERGATYAGWELLCLGRPACGESFTRGELRSELAISRARELAFIERGLFRGGDALLRARFGLAGHPVLATFVLAAPGVSASWVAALREALAAESGLFAATLVSGVLVLRFLGDSTREGRSLFERALAVLRPLYAGRAAVHPRIWST